VRRSQRARQIRLRVGADIGLEVVVPARGRLPDIPALLRERADWILRALDRVAAQSVPAAPPLADGATLPDLGHAHRLIVAPGPGVSPAVDHNPVARTLTARFDPATYDLRAVLDWWLRNRARATIAARVAHFSALMSVRHTRLTIRDTRSRWGSCSSRGGLNFSWRLILAPPPVLDYVVIHELAHLRELNHSPRFWAILAAHCPDYPRHQTWLKEYGATLHALLSAPETPAGASD
jgi:predicted metal-dependent hydrolase